MRPYFFPDGDRRGTYAMLVSDLLDTKPIQVGEWQAMNTSGSDLHKTHELEDVSLVWERIPETAGGIYNMIPYIDGEWAAEHFEERVSGQPLNPAPSHERWPYAIRGNTDHTTDQVFDHTYPERFWPKHAGHGHWPDSEYMTNEDLCGGTPGIRFHYGDLDDVVNLLVKSPLTRQAFLPVWFPEDTGATEGQRVPCTLGYHFMIRDGLLSCRYYLRSCDVYRHMSNDVFFAAALTTWICNRIYQNRVVHRDNPIKRVEPGKLIMHISSLHAFVGDVGKIKDRLVNL